MISSERGTLKPYSLCAAHGRCGRRGHLTGPASLVSCTETAAGGVSRPESGPAFCEVTRGTALRGPGSQWGEWNAGNGSRIRSAAVSSVDGGLRQRPGRSALPGGYLALEGVRTSKRIRSWDGSPGHRQLLCTETAAIRCRPDRLKARATAAVSLSVDGAARMDVQGKSPTWVNPSRQQVAKAKSIGVMPERVGKQPRAGVETGRRQLLSSECGGSRKGSAVLRAAANPPPYSLSFCAGGSGVAGGTDSGGGDPGCDHPQVSRRRPRTTPIIPDRRDTTFSLRP